MIDLRSCRKTSALLESLGLRLEYGKPYLIPYWDSATAIHLRARKVEQPLRQEAVRQLGQREDVGAIPFLGWVLLTDSLRHVRAEAVRALGSFPTPSAQALIALALADRSGLVAKAAREQLSLGPTETAFRVVLALWEDRALGERALDLLVALAQRAPNLPMRQALPVLERHARRFFLAPSQRQRLRACAQQLDTATAHLKDLPLTALPMGEVTDLPLPATGTQKTPTRSRPWWQLWHYWPRPK